MFGADALGIVVGLEAEAKIARRLSKIVEVGGGDAAGAAAACQRLIARGIRSLISFGLAGGLNPALRPGTLVVPDVVLSKDGHWPTHPPLAAWLGPVGGALYSGGSVLVTVDEKKALFARTGALAVDLESAAVAETAARHVLPFAVLRAICDPATRPLPRAALVALDPNGKIDGGGRLARGDPATARVRRAHPAGHRCRPGPPRAAAPGQEDRRRRLEYPL